MKSVRCNVKGKGKVHPRTGHEGPEGGRGIALLFLTLTIDEGGWSTPRPGRFTPGKDPVPFVQEAGWVPGPVWTGSLDVFERSSAIIDCFNTYVSSYRPSQDLKICRESSSPEIIIKISIIMAVHLERNKEDKLKAVLEQWHIIYGKSVREGRWIRLATSVRTKNEILLCFTFYIRLPLPHS
jgi:hypothetical protein